MDKRKSNTAVPLHIEVTTDMLKVACRAVCDAGLLEGEPSESMVMDFVVLPVLMAVARESARVRTLEFSFEVCPRQSPGLEASPESNFPTQPLWPSSDCRFSK